MGSVTIAQALHLPFPVLAAGVVAMAIGCFLGAEKLEALFAPKARKPVPVSQPSVRNRAFAAMGAVAALGLVTVALPKGAAPAAEKPLAKIGAVELAQKVVASPRDLWLLDLRAPKDAAEKIPGTLALPEGSTPEAFAATLPSTRTLVVYAQGDVAALPAGLRSFSGEVLALAGGFDAWKASVLTAPEPPAEPTPALVAEFRARSALNGYFTGAAAAPAPAPVVKAAAPAAAPRKGGGC